MYTALQKIHKDKDAEPTEFEETVAQAFFYLENTNGDIKSDLKDLYINSAMQVDVAGGKKAIVIHVPYRLRKAFRKIHSRLVRELEKKFSGKPPKLEKKRKERAHATFERKKQLTQLRIKAEKIAEEKLGSKLDVIAPIKY